MKLPGLRMLDLATVLGLAGAFTVVGVAMLASGRPLSFIDPTSFLIVFGGTFAVTLASFTITEVAKANELIFQTFLAPRNDPKGAARTVIGLAERARKDGLLSLQRDRGTLKMPTQLDRGLALVLEGMPADEVERLMRREVQGAQAQSARAVIVLRRAGEVAPAMGLIGTLVGLVQMLNNLEDPATIGPAMAVALLTTFYGVVLSNMIFAPLATKLERNTADEALVLQVYAAGIVSIGRQESPRRLEMMLNAMLPPGARVQYFD